MRCTYCGVEVTDYPANGICVCCGGRLPARPVGIRCPGCGTYSSGNFCSVCGRNLNNAAVPSQPAPVQPVQPVQTVYIPVQQMPYRPADICPKCGSHQVAAVKRGFSWGWGIAGFFLIPGFGILLGFCGSKRRRLKCTACGRKWKPN